MPLLEINYEIGDKFLMHDREIYNLIALIGDLGGVMEVFIFVVGVLVYPINKHSFTIKSLKRLFIARTTDQTIFPKYA